MFPSILASEVREALEAYLRTTFGLADGEIEGELFDFLEGESGMFEGPYVDVRLPYRKAGAGESVPLGIRPEFTPYEHQLRAWRRLSDREGREPEHTLVTTGTGSGKTESFLYPILDHCWRRRDEAGIKAILIYPMNALAGDQSQRVAEALWEDERLNGEVRAAKYVGGKGEHAQSRPEHLRDKRAEIRANPPDILLTNYRMLDLLLMRPKDRDLWRHNGPETLRYLVLDELHTYDGAQGSDVACLIRRLRARLGQPAGRGGEGRICCVGTSATIGGGSEASKEELREFAEKVFGAAFAAESVVDETRRAIDDVLADERTDAFPSVDDPGRFDPAAYADLEEFAAAQVEAWFGDRVNCDPLAVGRGLRENHVLKYLLQAAEGGPWAWSEFRRRFARMEPEFADLEESLQDRVLHSLLTLVSWARRWSEESGEEEPFLRVRVQSWLKELRRLIRKFDDEPCFEWEEQADDQEALWLPMVYCRECGESGFATKLAEGTSRVSKNPREIGRAYFEESRYARFVRIGRASGDRLQQYLCTQCRYLGTSSDCDRCEGRALPVNVWNGSGAEKVTHFAGKCPACQADDALTMLGSRAASLSSVAISQMFTSTYNDDKKLLAFTDSVQDASHRAGFFGARTFRFNLRTGIQEALKGWNGDGESPPPTLEELGRAVLGQWRDELDEERLVGTFWPPDLEWLEEYRAFAESDGASPSEELLDNLARRLSWEVTMEYGLRSRVGRTLELTGCSTAAPDAEWMAEAADLLHMQLVEEQLALGSERTSREEVRHFLEGLVDRVRTRGGIVHPLLLGYIGSEGARYMLSKRQNPLMSPFGPRSVLPRFLHSRRDAKTFDSYLSDPETVTWYRDWASRSMRLDPHDSGINDVYHAAVRALEEAGVFRSFDVGRDNRHDTAYGVVPAALRVSTKTERLVCDDCQRKTVVPTRAMERRVGSACTRYRCDGRLRRGEMAESSWYARVYESGKLQRIRSAEHTGLLEKDEREELEEQFKEGSGPEAPNLVVCTPTLEMGIDIGDLSTLMLCSVPPTTANYQQRVGRAGRESGNAFCLTVAESRPHDLYFFEQPMKMAAGDVSVPGCFLDAVDMLERQLAARCVDAWTAEDDEIRSVPRNVRNLLTSSGRKTFPGRFVRWCERQEVGFVDDFLAHFGEHVSDESRDQLRHYFESGRLTGAFEEAFDEIRDERDRLQRDYRGLEDDRDDAEQADMTPSEREQAIEEIERAMSILRGLLGELNDKNPFNVLTDASILPNYAFPEPGVRLQATVRTKMGGEEGQNQYVTEEFTRPAASALTELAPFNTFYAFGKQFEITELDLGNRARPLTETWRFCRACDFVEPEHEDADAPTGNCPRCGDSHWSDVGRVRRVLRFRRARTFVDAFDAVALDDTEERRRQNYVTRALVDAGPKNWTTAHVLEEMPFGFEFLRNVELRELNFGPEGHWNSTIEVGGNTVPEQGYEVCDDCGRVRRKSGPATGELEHAPYCRYETNDHLSETTEEVYLARSMRSEALRLLLPAGDVEETETTASFKAALELGLREKFQGHPQHLRVLQTSEPVSAGEHHRRHFLVVYDTVPGGTGYLKDFSEKEGFLKIIRLALDAMRSCGCDDGCYKCVYAYQHQWELEAISKQRAVDLLADIVDRREEFTQQSTLSNVEVTTQVESELERKFLDALAAELADQGWGEVMWQGKLCHTFEMGGRKWRIEPQVEIGPDEGVPEFTRADFVLRCISAPGSVRPAAVYCDGFAYHVQPDRTQARLHDDVRKRSAIIDSEEFVVWNVTWEDVEAFSGESDPGAADGLFDGGLPEVVYELFDRADVVGLRPRVLQENPVAQLLRYLRKPDIDLWRRVARSALLALVADEKPPASAEAIYELEERLESEAGRIEVDELPKAEQLPEVFGSYRSGRYMGALILCPAESLRREDPSEALVRTVMRLFDGHDARREVFKPSWTGFLHAMNVLQFAGRLQMVTSEGIERESEADAPENLAEESSALADGSAPEVELPETYVVEAQDFPELRPLFEAMVVEDWPRPALGIPADGYPIDVVWEETGVAVLADDREEWRRAAENEGWRVFAADEIAAVRRALDET